MLVSFKPFGPIRRVLQKSLLEIEVPEGSTVRDVIDEVLVLGNQELRELVIHQGEVSGNLIVLLNRSDVRTLQDGLSTVVANGDQIAILPHVQGG